MGSGGSFKTLELAGWSERAASYDAFTATLTKQAMPALLDAAHLAFGLDLLDLCCGTGLVSARAEALGTRVVGLDFSSAMIEVARAKGLAARFEVGDAEALPCGDGTFDRVVCNFGLFHLNDPDRAVAEARRVLRPSGRFAWTTWCGPDRSPVFRAVFSAVKEHGSLDVGLPPAPPPFRLADPAEAERTMRAAGFTDVTVVESPAELVWPLASLPEFLGRATVRMAMLLSAQALTVRPRIEAAIQEMLTGYADAGLLRVPMPAVVVAGGLP